MEDLVVAGNGMARIACLEQILKHTPGFNVTVFGDETQVNFNRILLSSVLAGERSTDKAIAAIYPRGKDGKSGYPEALYKF